MKVHPHKSQFITVNTTDTESFKFGDTVISYTKTYNYLGTPISNQHISKQVNDHLSTKLRHIRKFQSFVTKNKDAPYTVKHKV